MKEALQEIVSFLQRECGEGDMASVKINSHGDVYLSVGVCRDDPRMSLAEFAVLIAISKPRNKPKPLRPKGVKLKRTDRGTDPKYTWQFTPDNCFDCCRPFRKRDDCHLSFYTMVIDNRMARCCPECFPTYNDRWMI